MRTVFYLLTALLATGCYTSTGASVDINEAWRGRSLVELQARWGAPSCTRQISPSSTQAVWTRRRTHYRLPTLQGSFEATPEQVNLYAEAKAGHSSTSLIHTTASLDAGSLVLGINGPSWRRGAPNDTNLRWGLLMGFYAGMGRLATTSTALPSGGLYIGGMLSPTLGLVGSYSLASGSDDAGGAMGMAWAFGAQWWPQTRISLRAGPAMVLAFEPGFKNVGLEPGINSSASYALLKSGSFVLDIRLDATIGSNSRFAALALGVNHN